MGAADDGGRGGIHLEAAARAAGAGDAVGNDRAVAGFSGRAAHAVPDAAIENDAAADAGTEGVHDEGIDGVGAARAEEAFAVSGEGGVVADMDGAVKAALEFSAEIDSVKAGKLGRWRRMPTGSSIGPGLPTPMPSSSPGFLWMSWRMAPAMSSRTACGPS